MEAIATATAALVVVVLVPVLLRLVLNIDSIMDRREAREDRRAQLLADAQAVLGTHRFSFLNTKNGNERKPNHESCAIAGCGRSVANAVDNSSTVINGVIHTLPQASSITQASETLPAYQAVRAAEALKVVLRG